MSWIDDLMFTPDQDPTLGTRIKAADLAAAGGPGAPESRADALLQQQTARNIAAQFALGATIRSRSAGAASQAVSTGAADANANATEQGVALERQEQVEAAQRSDALHAYADQLSQSRANARNKMLGVILGDPFALQGNGTSTEAAAAPSEGSSDAASGQAAGAAGESASANAGLGLGTLSGAATDAEAENLVADDVVSDPRAKKNIRPAAGKVTAMIRALGAKGFEYRDAGNGGGQRVGIMTPALKATALGATAVIPGHPEKMDTGNAVGLALAALPTLEARIRALEGNKHAR